ncbi:hypothetical protein [Acidomonas methanolica]|uniref:hypothetical protein n=1 Tax=Acidomonas methanolica TaxID=437 RepID=UPI00211A143E|nr:hypothetical protein [Acidomonas methanolica]MCQ9154151.1 hypothetical protein [Acidomonas methanolica]
MNVDRALWRACRTGGCIVAIVIAFAGAQPAVSGSMAGGSMSGPGGGGMHFGAAGMPFDLARTLHIFTPLPDGGEQDVVSTDGDPAQIALIRRHLSTQAARRAKGDYSGPAAMHGGSMPGLKTLAAGAARMRIRFQTLPEGGRIIYQSRDPSLIAAVHSWFRAQVHDHGADAMLSHQ